jgi:hypothetical protein
MTDTAADRIHTVDLRFTRCFALTCTGAVEGAG